MLSGMDIEKISFNAPLELRIDAPADKDGKSKSAKLSGVAYSGAPVKRWGELYIIDLATLTVADNPPVLFQHDHRETVGVISDHANDGRSLSVVGELFSDIDETAREIAAKATRGLKYQMSVGAFDFSNEFVPAGNSVNVNGQQFNGPITVLRNGVVREVSVVALGADPDTTVELFARQTNDEEATQMPKPNTDQSDQAADLRAEIEQLNASLKAAEERAEAAETQLAEMRKAARLSAIKVLFSDTGLEFSEEQAAIYLEMPDEQFEAVSNQMRLAAKAKGEKGADGSDTGGAMFHDVGAGNESGQDDGNAVTLSIHDIYSKRRVS